MKKSLLYINEEIERYLYYFGLLISLNINIDLLFYQINILNSIKINVIQKNIDYYLANYEKISQFLIYRKPSKECFLFEPGKLDEEEDNDDEENIDDSKKLFKTIKQYYLNTENDGLNYLFFFQKPNIFKLDSLLASGIIMIGLSISGISYLNSILNEEVFKEVENIIGTNLNFNDYKEFINKRHEKDFPFSQEKSLMNFIKDNNIKIKNTNQDLLEIMKKYDKGYNDKINKEFGKTFRSVLRKKLEKLNLSKYKEFIEQENEDDNKYVNIALNNIKDLDEKKKKIILANNLMRRDGRDWLTDETRKGKDINERIQNAQEELGTAAEGVIIRELKESMNREILNQRELRDKTNVELEKQKEVLAKSRKSCSSLSDAYKLRQGTYNRRRTKNNDDIDQLNKKYDEYNKDNTKYDRQNLQNERNIIVKEQEELQKELDELNKDFEVVKKEEEIVEKERLFHNELVEESNKFNTLQNNVKKELDYLMKILEDNFGNNQIKSLRHSKSYKTIINKNLFNLSKTNKVVQNDNQLPKHEKHYNNKIMELNNQLNLYKARVIELNKINNDINNKLMLSELKIKEKEDIILNLKNYKNNNINNNNNYVLTNIINQKDILIMNLENQLNIIKKKEKALNSKINNLSNQFREKINRFENKMTLMEEKSAKDKLLISKLKNELCNKKSEISNLLERQGNINFINDNLIDNNAQNIKNLIDENNKLKIKIDTLNRELNNLQNQKKTHENKIENLENNLLDKENIIKKKDELINTNNIYQIKYQLSIK